MNSVCANVSNFSFTTFHKIFRQPWNLNMLFKWIVAFSPLKIICVTVLIQSLWTAQNKYFCAAFLIHWLYSLQYNYLYLYFYTVLLFQAPQNLWFLKNAHKSVSFPLCLPFSTWIAVQFKSYCAVDYSMASIENDLFSICILCTGQFERIRMHYSLSAIAASKLFFLSATRVCSNFYWFLVGI